MKQSVKNKLLALAAEDIIKRMILFIGMLSYFLVGVFIGYSFANKECEECPVGFATVADMMFLVEELRLCKGYE
jgi:hypothetical protein